VDFVVLRHAGHVLEEVAPVALGASVGSIITMNLIIGLINVHAGHVYEEVAPHAFWAGVGSIGAVNFVVLRHAGHVLE